MSSSTVKTDSKRQVTIVDVRGVASADHIIDLFTGDDYGATRKALWDLSDADISGLTHNDLNRISEEGKRIDEIKDVRIVAFVMKNQTDLSMARLFIEMKTHISQRKLLNFATTSRQEALAWLSEQTA